MYGFSGIADLLFLLVAMIGTGVVLLFMALVQVDAIVFGREAIAAARMKAIDAGLRAGGAAGSDDVAVSTRAAFEAEATKLQTRWRRVLRRTMVGFALVATPIALLEGNHDPALPVSVGAIAILAVVLVCTRRRRTLDGCLEQARRQFVS